MVSRKTRPGRAASPGRSAQPSPRTPSARPARSLLILACSEQKRRDAGLLAAIERYDGPRFRVVRKFLRTSDSVSIEIRIVSARFGLLSPNDHIPFYDQRLTLEAIDTLEGTVTPRLRRLLARRRFQRVFVGAGSNYVATMGGREWLSERASEVIFASGPPGVQLSQLRDWLMECVPADHNGC